jgi:hypothetical protein
MVLLQKWLSFVKGAASAPVRIVDTSRGKSNATQAPRDKAHAGVIDHDQRHG